MPKHKPLPLVERLHELFEIAPIAESQFEVHSGLVWKVSRGNQKAGGRAGSLRPSSKAPSRFDWKVKVDGRLYIASRLIYLMANGVDPGELQVDHEDQNPINNNVDNLRLGDDSLQGHNRGPRSDNTSGAVGVSWHRESDKWQANLKHKGTYFHLGRYTCKIEAARAYNDRVVEFGLDKIGKPLNDLETVKCGCVVCQ